MIRKLNKRFDYNRLVCVRNEEICLAEFVKLKLKINEVKENMAGAEGI